MAQKKIKTTNPTKIELERFRIIDSLISNPKIISTTENIATACKEELEKIGFKPNASLRTINDSINRLREFIKDKLAEKLDENDEVIHKVKAHLTLKNGIVPDYCETEPIEETCRQTIFECLTNTKEVFSKADLLKKCNEQLEQQGYAPIAYKKITSIIGRISEIEEMPECWRYTNPNFTFRSFFPSTDLFANFQQLILFLSNLPSDKYDWANDAAEHIKESFHLPTVTEDIISFDENDNKNTTSCFSEILSAISEKKAISICYVARNTNKDKEKEVWKEVSPYFLKQYGKDWQLYAKVVGSKRPYDQFSLNRIVDYNDSNPELVYEPTDIDFHEELEDVIGFTVPNHKHKIEHIKLLVSEGKYPFLRDTPLHASQHIIEKIGNNYIIGIDVTPNLELEKQLLIHIDGVTVLEPQSLKEQIEDYLNDALKRYTEASANDATAGLQSDSHNQQ